MKIAEDLNEACNQLRSFLRVMDQRDEPRITDLRALIARRRRAERTAARLEAPQTPAPPQTSLLHRALHVGAVVFVALVIGVVWYWQATEAGRALRGLPAGERGALYQRTLGTLRDVCEPAPPRSLRAFCREQAALVLELDECDTLCREIATRNLSTPTR